MPKRKKHAATIKFQVALKVVQTGNATQVGRQYGVSHTLASRWKKHLLEKGSQIFEGDKSKEQQKLKSQISKLEQIIGRKEVEINLLKNFLEVCESPDGM